MKKHIISTYLSQVISVIISFGTSILISRILGASGRGEFAVFTNSLALATAWLGFSLSSSIIYYVASNKIEPNKIFYSLIWFTLFTGLLVFIGIKCVFLLGLQGFIFPSNHSDMSWVLLFIFQFLVTAINNLVIGFLNAKQKFIHISASTIIFSFLTLIVYLLFYFKWLQIKVDGFTLIILSTLFTTIIQLLINLVIYVRYVPNALKYELISWAEAKQIASYSFVVWLCNAFQFLSYRMDIWFVDYYHGSAETGVYSLAVSLAQMVLILPNSIASILYSYTAKGTMQEAVYHTLKLSIVAIVACFVLSAGALIFFTFFVPWAYGKEFSGSIPMTFILLLSIVPFSLPTLIATFFAGRNKVMNNLYATLFSFVFCLLGYAILIKPLGGIGAALASSIGYISGVLFQVYKFYPYVKKNDVRFPKFSEIFNIKSIYAKRN